MKKYIFPFALVAVVSLLSVNAMAWGRQAGQGYGGCANYTSEVDSKAYNEFWMQLLRADRAEMAAEMAGQSPDSKRVRALTEKVQKNIDAIQVTAEAMNIPANAAMGRGQGRGMGNVFMRGAMMRNNGFGFDCPVW